MENGIPVNVTSFSTDPDGHGTMIVAVDGLADFKGIVARLHPGTIMFDKQQVAHYVRLEDEPPAPAAFPAECVIRFIETAPPADGVVRRMNFGNGYLGGGAFVQVVEFEGPTKEGAPGHLRFQVDSPEEFTNLLRFLDEPRGSSLSAWDGSGQWYVHRTSGGDIDLRKPFPQRVEAHLEWRRD